MAHFKSIEPVKYDRKKHNISFKNAFNGILLAYRTQPNFRFHCLFFVMVMVSAVLFRISYMEFLALFLVSTMVFVAEMVNTAVEALGDEIAGNEYRKLIGVAKDVSAGAVLISALSAGILGVIVFLPKFIELIPIAGVNY